MIVEEVERLRWRIWNGKAKNAKRSIDRVRKVMHVYKEELGLNMRSAPSHRLWHALLDVDGYLRSQSSWLVKPRDRIATRIALKSSDPRRHDVGEVAVHGMSPIARYGSRSIALQPRSLRNGPRTSLL